MAKRIKPKNKAHRIHRTYRKCEDCGKKLDNRDYCMCRLGSLFS